MTTHWLLGCFMGDGRKGKAVTVPELAAWVKAGVPGAKSLGQGLTLTLSKAGLAAWVLRYRHGGKQKELSMGRWPEVPLADARVAAAGYRVRVAAGEDVAASKRLLKLDASQAVTLKGLATDYLAVAKTQLKAGSYRQRERLLMKEVVPKLGHIRADGVKSADVVNLVQGIAAHSPSTAEIVLVCLRQLYHHAKAKRLFTDDPTLGLKITAVIGKREVQRAGRSLSRDELALLMRQLPSLGAANELALRLLLLTGVRKMELQGARWADVDMERGLWVIPEPKNHRTFTVPLAPQAVACFRRLHELAPKDAEVVLPIGQGRARGNPFSSSRLNMALDRLANFEHFTPHDLRRTVRTHLGEMGVSVVVAERCLNHSLGGLLEVYDRSDYMDERRRALAQWADYLDSLERGGKVVLGKFGSAA